MKRLSRAPLFVQVLGLVVIVTIAAQIISLVALLAMPRHVEPFTFGDIATSLRSRAPLERQGQVLIVEPIDPPPAYWDREDRQERRSRATLAQLTGLPLDRIRVEKTVQVPPLDWVMRLNQRTVTEPAPPALPFEDGANVIFYDMAAALRGPDGRWTRVDTPTDWGAAITLLTVWGSAFLLILAPLAWRFTRRIVQPIRAFADTAERAGRGDRDAVFAASGPREVRKAAEALGEMQRKIAGAVEERTNLIAAIAHDLRSPLARLRFKVEDLEGERREAIVRDIERMDAMIAGVLAFARGEARAERRRIDLAALVQSLADDLVETGADVAMAEAAPVEVEGDAIALRRLIGNLIDNAVRYGGRARCLVRRDGGKALLLIEDEGPGIDEESLERMFTPFVRGDSARDPATGGVGLGLAIARAIARAHGGEVRLKRRTAGGLCAEIELPAAAWI